MTNEQYEQELANIHAEYNAKKRVLYKNYALSNSSLKIGDMVTDHQYTIKIDKIRVTLNYYGKPYCIYSGLIYNKNGKPNAKDKIGEVHQTNI